MQLEFSAVKRIFATAVLTLCAASAAAQTASMTAHFINIGQGQSAVGVPLRRGAD